MTMHSQTKGQYGVPVHIDHNTLVEAARLVLKTCFTPKFGWSYKSFNGIPMGISTRQKKAVRALAALFDEYDDADSADRRA